MNNPIVIIGMHRSGTTLLSKLLENFGVFFGKNRDENNEAKFFLDINRWIFLEANASWDNPYNYKFTDKYFEEKTAEIVKFVINSPLLINYLGVKNYFKYRKLINLNIPWGWKDPRTIFTINIWKRLFPNLKIIHIYRNPIDVANSLRQREIKIRRNFELSLKIKIKILLKKDKIPYVHSIRCMQIDEGIKLWMEYMKQAKLIEQNFKKNFYSIQYESFLDNPNFYINKIIEHCNMNTEEISKEQIQQFIKNINASRKFAFLNKKDLIEKYNSLKNNELVQYFGYGNIDINE